MRAKLALAVAGLILPFAAVSQDNYVVFQNSVLTPPPDRLVRNVNGDPLVGTNYMAQLLMGSSPDSLQPLPILPSRFRPEGTSLPGTWVGGNISIPLPPGTEVTMQVRIWDSNFGLTFDQACAFGYAGVLPTFTWLVPGTMAPPQDHYMQGFVGGIPLPCPEPATVALLCLAPPLLALWGAKRRRL
jgi:hypothetical protein